MAELLDPQSVSASRAAKARQALEKAEAQLDLDRKELAKAVDAKAPVERLELIGDVVRLGQIRATQLAHCARDYDTIAAGKRVFG